MLVIIEGVDGVGKTTVAEALQGLTDGELLHASQPKGDWQDEYILPLDGYHPTMGGRHIICDRWHLGEMVYGPLYRGEVMYDSNQFILIETILLAYGAVQVYMTEDKRTVMERWDDRGESFLKVEHYDTACDMYERAVRMSHLPTLRMDGPVTRKRLNRIITVARAFEACMHESRERFDR